MTDIPTSGEFEDIRPYTDAEVPAVMARLMDSPELADTILAIRYPRLSRYLGRVLRPLIRRRLHRAFDGVRTVWDLQMLIGRHMEIMLEKSGASFSFSGLEQLDDDRTYLFMSNHRDIAMDPAFVNLALHRHGRDTVRIAIGDNLLSRPFAADLMRLNKSFIVKRSVTGRREKLAALKTLSRYIRHSLLVDRACVWIAQREGRAKDGLDRTDTALLKMLVMGKERSQSFREAIDELAIVPVSISYMFDPCDLDKARELHQRRTSGEYRKSTYEDLVSIYKGIVGDKGAVHVAFGSVIQGLDDDDAVAAEIDRQIIGNYHLHPTNLVAWERLHGPDPRLARLKARCDCDWKAVEAELLRRTELEDDGVRWIFMEMYANPVQSYFDLRKDDAPVD